MLFRTDPLAMDVSNPRLFLLLSSVNAPPPHHSSHYYGSNESLFAAGAHASLVQAALATSGGDLSGNAVFTGVSIGLLIVAGMGLLLLCFTGFAYATKKLHTSGGYHGYQRHRGSSLGSNGVFPPTSATPLISSISAVDAVLTAETIFSIQNQNASEKVHQDGDQTDHRRGGGRYQRLKDPGHGGVQQHPPEVIYQYSHSRNTWVPTSATNAASLMSRRDPEVC